MAIKGFFGRVFCMQEKEVNNRVISFQTPSRRGSMRKQSLEALDGGRTEYQRRSSYHEEPAGKSLHPTYNRFMRRKLYISARNAAKLKDRLGLRMHCTLLGLQNVVFFDDDEFSCCLERVRELEFGELYCIRWESRSIESTLVIEKQIYHRGVPTEVLRHKISVLCARKLFADPWIRNDEAPSDVLEALRTRGLRARMMVQYRRTLFQLKVGEAVASSIRMDENIRCTTDLLELEEPSCSLNVKIDPRAPQVFRFPKALISIYQAIDPMIATLTRGIEAFGVVQISPNFNKYILACARLRAAESSDFRISWVEKYWRGTETDSGPADADEASPPKAGKKFLHFRAKVMHPDLELPHKRLKDYSFHGGRSSDLSDYCLKTPGPRKKASKMSALLRINTDRLQSETSTEGCPTRRHEHISAYQTVGDLPSIVNARVRLAV